MAVAGVCGAEAERCIRRDSGDEEEEEVRVWWLKEAREHLRGEMRGLGVWRKRVVGGGVWRREGRRKAGREWWVSGVERVRESIAKLSEN